MVLHIKNTKIDNTEIPLLSYNYQLRERRDVTRPVAGGWEQQENAQEISVGIIFVCGNSQSVAASDFCINHCMKSPPSSLLNIHCPAPYHLLFHDTLYN